MKDVMNNLTKLGIEWEGIEVEYGSSQFEIQIKYGDLVRICDEVLHAKDAIRLTGHKFNFNTSFMAKTQNESGNSGHLHISLNDKDGKNIFEGDDFEVHPSGIKCSNNLIYFIGGLCKYGKDFVPMWAPNVNSYKRFVAYTFAPTCLTTWGYENRCTTFRITGKGSGIHLENRIPGADLNPYLAFAATMACGLRGIEEKIQPPPITTGDGYESPKDLPNSLKDALNSFQSSPEVAEMIGELTRDQYSEIYMNEWNLFEAAVTDWEINRYADKV
jgi:glutamine synthetase